MNVSTQPPEKILYVIASLRGGAAEHLLYLIEYFTRQGKRIDLAAPDDCPATAKKLQAAAPALNWIRLPLHKRFCLDGTRRLAQALVEGNIDLVHSHGLRGGHYARAAVARARKAGHPVRSVYTIHGFHPAYYTNPLARYLALAIERRHLKRGTDLTIFVSESDRELFTKLLKQDPQQVEQCSVLVPNGIRYPKPESFPDRAEARQAFGLNRDDYAIGTLSRLNRQKAVHVLIEAAARLKPDIPRLRVLIGGDGPLEKKLHDLARQRGVADTIRFLGYYGDPMTLYAALDGFCLSSLWEGLPLTLLEAAGAGLPIVASQVAGTVEVLEHEKTGFLFESGDVDGLAAGILRLYQDRALGQRLGQNARQTIPERFSLEKMLEKTDQAYQNLFRA